MKEIPLTRGKIALVDDEDYNYLIRQKWGINNYGYAIHGYVERRLYTRSILMHRLIMNAPKDKQVDHINGDKLDNRKCNLRLCTSMQNSQNQKIQIGRSSKYKGVCWRKNNKIWEARINFKCKCTYLGYFDIEGDAARAYDKKALELFGEFAHPNFPRRIPHDKRN